MLSFLYIIIIGIIIILTGVGVYFLFKSIRNNNINPPKPDCKKCANNCCEDGENCQSDNATCCKNELWGKDINGVDKCCQIKLCGNICCNSNQSCGKDKNNNPTCCSSKLCGTNNTCCDLTGENCQSDNATCCKDELWGKDKLGNNKCCLKPLCNGICCDSNEECDSDTNKCVSCSTITCNGDCCPLNYKCYKGLTTKKCCNQELCGDNCCESEQTCMPDKTCCDMPCEKGKKCCPDGYSCTTNDICCKDNISCVDELGNPICYDQNLCGKDKNGKCICCKKGEKFDSISSTCKTYCGDNELCDLDNQYCVSENGNYIGCANKECVWSTYNYDPPTIIDNNKNASVCKYQNRYYVISDPLDPSDPNKHIPLSMLTRSSYVGQDPSSKVDCTINNCKEKINEAGMQFVNYDDKQKICIANFNCSKLPLLKDINICPLLHGQSCCNDENGKFTGQICSNNRICYKGNCVCNQNEVDNKDNCIYLDRKHTCNGNGDINYADGTCICDSFYSGKNCETKCEPGYDSKNNICIPILASDITVYVDIIAIKSFFIITLPGINIIAELPDGVSVFEPNLNTVYSLYKGNTINAKVYKINSFDVKEFMLFGDFSHGSFCNIMVSSGSKTITISDNITTTQDHPDGSVYTNYSIGPNYIILGL
jgi:hypothetical protein